MERRAIGGRAPTQSQSCARAGARAGFGRERHGARHKSAAAITVVVRAVAITVSESTGNVTVFRGGKILIEIDRPRPIGSAPPFPEAETGPSATAR